MTSKFLSFRFTVTVVLSFTLSLLTGGIDDMKRSDSRCFSSFTWKLFNKEMPEPEVGDQEKQSNMAAAVVSVNGDNHETKV